MTSECIYQHEISLAHDHLTARRAEFLELMSWQLYNPTVDWELYWQLFYSSDLTAETAYENSII